MRLIFVVGTARSGTSAVTTLIERMGAKTLPKTVSGKYNPDYQENYILNALCYGIHPWHKLQKETSINVDTNIKAIASYILEHTQADTTLVLKCPAFPFIIPELIQVVRTIGSLLPDVKVDVTFIHTQRGVEPQIASMQRFTMETWPDEHWIELINEADNLIFKYLDNDNMIVYEQLLENWQVIAQSLANRIEGLTVPEDGGIDPTLNHAEAAA